VYAAIISQESSEPARLFSLCVCSPQNEMRLKQRKVLNPINSRTNLGAGATVQMRYGPYRKPRKIRFWKLQPSAEESVIAHLSVSNTR
jgi:hypothetical protein